MASNNDPDNEDNIINTTIVELFALIIFLFIIALSAFSVWSEALYREAKPQEKLDDRGELQQKKIQPGQRDGIVLMPVFEGIPACLYRVNDVTYRESIKQTGNQQYGSNGGQCYPKVLGINSLQYADGAK